MEVLDLHNVSFSYNRSEFIKNLSVSINSGDFIGLVGANGSGKSTILRLAAGILKPHSGEVTLWGKQIHQYNGRDRAKLVSYLPQMLDMNSTFTVREIAGMGLYPYDISPELSLEKALEIVGLDEKGDSYMMDLSGGERRRVFIAMILLQGAGLLLLDEPLANLDIKYQLELIALLRNLRDSKNISVIMALHDINMALRFDNIYVVKEGRLIACGEPHNVITGEVLKSAFGIDSEVYLTPLFR